MGNNSQYCRVHKKDRLQQGFVCLRQNCDYETRFICLGCTLAEDYREHFLQHNKDIVQVQQITQYHDNYGQWPSKESVGANLKEILEFFCQNQSDPPEYIGIIDKKINDVFNQFQKKIIDLIQNLKDSIINQAIKQQQESLNILQDFDLHKFFDLKDIEMDLKLFLNGKKTETQVNMDIQNQINNKYEYLNQNKQEIIQKWEQQKNNKDQMSEILLNGFFEDIVKSVNDLGKDLGEDKGINFVLKQDSIKPQLNQKLDLQHQQKKNPLFNDLSNIDFWLNLKPTVSDIFSPSPVKKNLKFSLFGQVQVDDIYYLPSQNVIISQLFNLQEQVAIKLRINGELKKGMQVLGFFLVINFYEKENHCNSINFTGSSIINEKNMKDSMNQEKQEYSEYLKNKQEICLNLYFDLKKDLFILMDDDNTMMYRSKNNFVPKKSFYWNFRIGTDMNQQIQVNILKFEILAFQDLNFLDIQHEK